MLVVALTGGIGSGKSTASDRFAALGVPVIDADVLAREATAPGSPALDRIAQAFGEGVLGADGSLDRSILRRLVFTEPSARKRLEAILHPLIRARMRERIAEVTGPYVLLVIPLLFETGQTDLADRVLVVDAPEAVQLSRVGQRSGLEPDEIAQIMASQASRDERLRRADDVIDNSGHLDALFAQIHLLHERYKRLAHESPHR